MQLNSKIKAYYFTPFDILRSRTNQISDVRFCEGLAQNQLDITLVAPYVYRKSNLNRKRILDFYGVQESYDVKLLPTLFFQDVDGKLRVSIMVSLYLMYFSSLLVKNIFSKQTSWIISRSKVILYPICVLNNLLGKPLKIICWSHEIKQNKIYDYVFHSADLLLATNTAIMEDIEQFFGLPSSKILLTYNPITEAQIQKKVDRQKAREILDLPKGKLVVYTGKVFIGQKEIDYILAAAKRLPQYQFLFTGGKPKVVGHLQKYCVLNQIENVSFTGYLQDYREIQLYQQAADVLVSYYTEIEHDVRYNLPQKITEYMLSGNVIVSPNFEATRDLLNTENCVFVNKEDAKSLEAGIIQAMEEKSESQRKGKRAQALAKTITFKRVAKRIIQKLKQEL